MDRKHPAAECENCDLFTIGRYVPSDGPARADLAFVGEAPGANEARLGKPFVGVSGQLLGKVLQHYHIDREGVLLSNACLCRPPDNATPSANAIRACRPRLLQELEERGVRKVVAMGNSAAGTLLGTSGGITKLRIGPPREVPELGLQVIPTLHPAACLRPKGDAFFPSIVNDIGKLFRPTDDWTEPTFVVIDDLDMALKAVDELPLTPITVDIESDIDKDVSFEHSSRHRLLCIGIGYGPNKVVVFGETVCNTDRFLRKLGIYLRGHNRIIAQNGKFDLEGLYHRMGAMRLWFDTMLASYCLDERRGIHGLKYLAVELLGAPRYDDEIKQYLRPGAGYGTIPRDILYRYNAYDCAATYALWQLFTTLLEKEPGLRALHDFLVRVSNELMFVEINGIGVDLKYNAELEEFYVRRLAVLRRDMQITTGRPDFNPNSPMQIVSVLTEVFGIAVPKKRNQAGEWRPCTDKEVIAYLVEKCKEPWGEYYDFLTSLQEHRIDAKSYGTYVKGIKQRVYKGRVFPTYLLHGTTTGRASCRNPNIQNVTRGMRLRKQFVPVSQDNIFVQADYKQIEARIMTWFARDEYLRDIFNDPSRDLFDEFTAVLYGDVSHLTPPQKKELRIRVKAYFYGLGYGREAKSIADEFGISLGEAQRGMKKFFSVIPGIVDFREETKRAVRQGEDLTTPFGRRRRFFLITKDNLHEIMNEALAFKPQSTASDICWQAFSWLRPALKGKGWVRNIVHDSILVETRRDRVGEVSDLLRYHMCKSGRLVVGDFINIEVDITTGENWGVL
jgi:uracil-DNA glycosylase family 4